MPPCNSAHSLIKFHANQITSCLLLDFPCVSQSNSASVERVGSEVVGCGLCAGCRGPRCWVRAGPFGHRAPVPGSWMGPMRGCSCCFSPEDPCLSVCSSSVVLIWLLNKSRSERGTPYLDAPPSPVRLLRECQTLSGDTFLTHFSNEGRGKKGNQISLELIFHEDVPITFWGFYPSLIGQL